VKFLKQRLAARGARGEARRALERLGASLPPSARVAAIDARIDDLTRAIPLSMERDRGEWAEAPAWARWLVMLRGIADRSVLRALRHRKTRERAAARLELALASLQSAEGEDARLAREAHERAAQAEAALQPLPVVVAEAQHLVRAVLKEARGQLVPRAPALVGLAVGWWIAQTFTDSELTARLHSWGLGSGPRRAVGGDTLRAMSFWLPLAAAAACSYLGTRLSALIRARYASVPDAAPVAAEGLERPR
jgi:hypothetical protein